MNALELEFDNQRLKAHAAIQTSKAMEGSIEIASLCKLIGSLLRDFESHGIGFTIEQTIMLADSLKVLSAHLDKDQIELIKSIEIK